MSLDINHKKTLLLLFLEGFVSVSLQIFIIRQMVPFAGSSAILVSFVIGVFLAALSLGYLAGGRHKKDHLWILNKNLVISAFLIAIGFSYPIIDYSFNLFGNIFDNNFIETGIYLTIFLAPVVFLLGQTIPLLTNFMKTNNVAELTGVALSVNTIGSVLGSVVTSLVLFYYLGVAYTLLFDICLIMLISIMIGLKDKNITLINVGALMLVITIGTFLNVQFENSKFKLTNHYTNYEVLESEYEGVEISLFKMNDSYSSAIYKSARGTASFKYIDFMFDSIQQKGFKDKKILVLGAGGFTLSLRDKTKNHYTYVDIDPKIKEVAEKYFIKGKINGDFIADDARQFLLNSKNKYDMIRVDLFTNRVSIPWHTSTKEFMDALKGVMKEESTVMFNIIQGTDFNDKYSKTVYNTITTSFDYCMVNQMLGGSERLSNVVYSCILNKEKKEVYIDNFSRVEFDALKVRR